jgi:hypothetical protein
MIFRSPSLRTPPFQSTRGRRILVCILKDPELRTRQHLNKDKLRGMPRLKHACIRSKKKDKEMWIGRDGELTNNNLWCVERVARDLACLGRRMLRRRGFV